MKLTNLFCLSFAFAAVGSSASFYFFSDPVHAAVSLPQKAVLVREAGTTLAVADYRSDAAFDRVVVGSQQALRDAVQEGNWQTDSTVLRTPETPQDKLRRTSAEQATTQNRAKHSTRGVTPEAGDNDGRTMGVLVERMPTTQTESFIPEPQEGSAIPMYVSRLGVAPARSGQRNQPPVTDKLSAGELKPAVFPAVMVPPSSETGMTSLQLAE